MPYELTLRPKDVNASVEILRQKLVDVGLESRPDSIPPGLLSDGFALFEPIDEQPDGAVVIVKLPYCRPLLQISQELLTLGMIAEALNAELLDGDHQITLSADAIAAPQDLMDVLDPFWTRYHRASRAAAAVLGTIRL